MGDQDGSIPIDIIFSRTYRFRIQGRMNSLLSDSVEREEYAGAYSANSLDHGASTPSHIRIQSEMNRCETHC